MSGACETGDITPEEAAQVCICGHGRTDHDGTFNTRECWADTDPEDCICPCPLFSERPPPSE
jgi:hypothetical protein